MTSDSESVMVHAHQVLREGWCTVGGCAQVYVWIIRKTQQIDKFYLQLIPLRASSATTIASVKSAPIQLSATSRRTLPPSLDGLPPTATGRINIDDEVIEVSEYIA